VELIDLSYPTLSQGGDMPQWKDFVSWVFFGLLAYFGYSITGNVDSLTESVASLNKNVAVLLAIQGVHGENIKNLEGNMKDLSGRVLILEKAQNFWEKRYERPLIEK
jgi:cell division protein FtsB